HLDAHGMKGLHVLAIMAPVAIGALEHDAALFQHALLDQAHVEITTGHVLDPQGQVFEVDEYGTKRLGGHRMKSPSCVAKQNNCNSAQVYQCAGRMRAGGHGHPRQTRYNSLQAQLPVKLWRHRLVGSECETGMRVLVLRCRNIARSWIP